MISVSTPAVIPETLDLHKLIPCPEAIASLALKNAKRLGVLPVATWIENDSRALLLACADNFDISQRERVVKLIDPLYQLRFITCPMQQLQQAIDECYRTRPSFEQMLNMASECTQASAGEDLFENFQIEFVNALLMKAVRMRASDIHLSPDTSGLTIRLRIDGVLIDFATLDIALLKRLVVRLKIMASLDIAETRFAQDGQFGRLIDGHSVDFRMSTFPTIDGENTVLRLIDPQRHLGSLGDLAVPDVITRSLTRLMHQPDGLIVVCGPTGAGKSTTLFALLAELDKASLNIMTLEDPVEHRVSGIRQTTIDASRQWGYAQGLRALLRQDPDVLMIGEIRDTESCAMALRAVSTGHQVLTTIHASCAHSALHRLRELNASGGALALSLKAIVAQRLVRRCCPVCHGAGYPCIECHGIGYHGRQVVMELLEITPRIATMLAGDAHVEDIFKASALEGFKNMQKQAAELIGAGITSQEEIDRVLVPDQREAITGMVNQDHV